MADSTIFTATPILQGRGSVRTTSPWHFSLILPFGLLISTEKLINCPSSYAISDVQKNKPDALISRVTPWASFRTTGRAVWIRGPFRFSVFFSIISRATPSVLRDQRAKGTRLRASAREQQLLSFTRRNY